MDDWRVGLLLLGGGDPFAVAFEAGDERVVAIDMLDEQVRQVGRKSLTQPDVVPITLGHAVSEPGMRDFVSHERGDGRAGY